MEYEPHERIPMQFLIFEGEQDPSLTHEEEFSGAFINCWIKNQTSQNAIHISKGWIQDAGWIIKQTEEQRIVTEDDYSNGEDGRDYFEQALVDEEIFVFHTFPKEK